MTITDIRDLTLDTPWPEDSDSLTYRPPSPATVEARVVEMRRGGCSIPTIAGETGLTAAQVSGVLKRVTDSVLAYTSAADVRAESLAYYDHLLELVMARIVRPGAPTTGGAPEGDLNDATLDFKAIDAALKIIEARRRLMGADSIVTHKLDVSAETKAKDEEGTQRTEDFLGQVERFMDFADQIAARGLGSGRQQTDISEEARAAGLWVEDTADEEVVDAEVVEDDAEPEIAGRWVAGRFVPDE